MARAGCSLSPRGDGYQQNAILKTVLLDAAYPREGTVTGVTTTQQMLQSDAAYPREGTVTETSTDVFTGTTDAAYPREGTVTRRA